MVNSYWQGLIPHQARENMRCIPMDQNYDCLVIGAGFAGAVDARELAERGGKRVLVL